MNWRPEGWKNPYLVEPHSSVARTSDAPIYEAGADAMLEAIREEIEKVENPYLRAGFQYPKEYEFCFERCRQEILALLKEEV